MDKRIASLSLETQDFRHLITGDSEGKVSLFDLELLNAFSTSRSELKWQKRAHSGEVEAHWYPIDPGMIVSAGKDERLLFWDANYFEVVCDVALSSPCHISRSCPFKPLVAACLASGEVRLVDARMGSCVMTLNRHKQAAISIDWSPLHDYQFVTGSSGGEMLLWDARVGIKGSTVVKANDSSAAHEGLVMCVRHTASGDNILSAGSDEKLKVWNTLHGRLEFEFREFVPRTKKPWKFNLLPGPRWGEEIVITPSVVDDGAIVLTNLYHGKGIPFQVLHGHFDAVTASVFRTPYHQMISVANDGMMLVWDAQMPGFMPNSIGNGDVQAVGEDFCDVDIWGKEDSSSREFYPTGVSHYLEELEKEHVELAQRSARDQLQRAGMQLHENTTIKEEGPSSGDSKTMLSQRARKLITAHGTQRLATVSSVSVSDPSVRSRNSELLGESFEEDVEIEQDVSNLVDKEVIDIRLRKRNAQNASSLVPKKKNNPSIRALFSKGKLPKR